MSCRISRCYEVRRWLRSSRRSAGDRPNTSGRDSGRRIDEAAGWAASLHGPPTLQHPVDSEQTPAVTVDLLLRVVEKLLPVLYRCVDGTAQPLRTQAIGIRVRETPVAGDPLPTALAATKEALSG